jgi:hypothetical protein
MNRLATIRAVFLVAALYDGILGVAFLLAAPALCFSLGVPPPNHWGYIHFPALLLVAIAIAFLAIARDPVANRNLIPYGIMLKLSYSGTVLYHWFSGGVP